MKKTIAVLCCAYLVSSAWAERAWWDPRPSTDELKATVERTARERLGVGVKVDRLTAGWAEPAKLHGITISDAQGRTRLALRELELQGLAPLAFTIRDAEVPQPGSPDGVMLKVPLAQVSVAFVAGDERQFTIAVTAPSGQLTGPRPIAFAHGTAGIVADAGGPASVRFGAGTLGGRIEGTLERPERSAKAPRLTATLSGISLAALAGKSGSERLDATFNGALPTSLKDLQGHGRATIHGLAVDLTNDPQLVALDRQASQGQTGTRILGAFVRDERLRGVTGMMSAQADYYRDLVASLRRRHSLGSAGGPLAISRGVATISPFSGAQLSGRITVNLASKGLSGHFSRIRVGRATLGDVRVSGTISRPRHTVNRNSVTLDGKPAPRALAMKSPKLDAIVKTRPERLLRDVLGSGLFR